MIARSVSVSPLGMKELYHWMRRRKNRKKWGYVPFWHLLDTHGGMILIYTGFAIPFCTWLLNGYFRAIPEDLEQAAMIDGCNRFELLWRIILPLAAPAIVAVGTFAFLLSWNEFLFAYVFTKSNALTIPVGLRAAFLGQYVNKYDQLFAASLIFSLPPIAIFVSLQRYFVQGLTAGAVKE